MPCSRRNPGSSSNNTVLGTSALPMYHSTYQLEPAVSGFRWMSVDRYWVKILNPDNDLRRSLAFGGRPWKVEVERAKGIEPFSMVCQFVPNLLNTGFLLVSPARFVSVCSNLFDTFSTCYLFYSFMFIQLFIDSNDDEIERIMGNNLSVNHGVRIEPFIVDRTLAL